MIAHLVATRKHSVLAIDADPNSCLADSLGVKGADTIVGECETISKNMDKIPAGMTKDRYIEMKVQEAVTEEDGFDLLVMGQPEGPGCYCYVNNLLRSIVSKITAGYDFVVIDNAAGMEHISRRTTASMNKLVIVSDYSVSGLRSAGKIRLLAKNLGIKAQGAYLIVNKVSGPIASLKDEISASGLEVLGELPHSKVLIDWNISNRSIFEFRDKSITDNIEEIFSKMMKENHAGRTLEGKI